MPVKVNRQLERHFGLAQALQDGWSQSGLWSDRSTLSTEIGLCYDLFFLLGYYYPAQ